MHYFLHAIHNKTVSKKSNIYHQLLVRWFADNYKFIIFIVQDMWFPYEETPMVPMLICNFFGSDLFMKYLVGSRPRFCWDPNDLHTEIE